MNREWLWLPIAACVFLLTSVRLWRAVRSGFTPRLSNHRVLLVLLGLWTGYGIIHWVPVPRGDGWYPLSPAPVASFLTWVQTVFLAASVWLVFIYASNARRASQLLGAIAISAFLQAAFAAVMTLSGLEWTVSGPKTISVGLATGSFVNRNHLAGCLELGIAAGIGLMVMRLKVQEDERRRFLYETTQWLLGPQMRMRLMLVVMIVGLILTRSRMGNTAVLVSLLIVGGLALAQSRRAERSLRILLISLLIIDLFIVGIWFGVDQVVERVRDTQVADVFSVTGGRMTIPGYAIRAWYENSPILGTGAGTFETVFPSVRDASIRNHFDHAHQDFAEFLVEYGLVGCLLLLSIISVGIRSIAAGMRRGRSQLSRGIAFSAIMGLCAIAIHSTVDFNLHIPANAFWVTILFAIGVAYGGRHRNLQ